MEHYFMRLMIADKIGYLNLVCQTVFEYVNNNPNIDLSDVERMLREHNCKSYLIAKPKCTSTSKYTISKIHDEFKKYVLNISVLGERESIEEILSVWNSYEENLEMLKHTGFETSISNRATRKVMKHSEEFEIFTRSQQERDKCLNCQSFAQDVTIKFKACARCKIATYCSIECQKENWKIHKSECKELTNNNSNNNNSN
jgi:hypothetical protein